MKINDKNHLVGSSSGATSRDFSNAIIRTGRGSLTTQHLLFKGQLDNTEERLAQDDTGSYPMGPNRCLSFQINLWLAQYEVACSTVGKMWSGPQSQRST